MKVEVSLNRLSPELDLEQEEVRCRQLMRTFVSERFTETLIEIPEVQKEFIGWLESRDNKASHETLRWEMRRLRTLASRHARLSTLEEEAERVLLDTRNIVADKSTKAAISRMVDEAFLKKMQVALEKSVDVTPTMRTAFIVFSATLMTGLRPSEWPTCVLSEPTKSNAGHPTLTVQTAKGKRVVQEPRTLILEDFGQAQLNMIQAAIDAAQELTNHQFGHLSTSLRKLAKAAVETEKEEDLLASLDLGTGRKMYAVESLREGRSKRAVAGALGHTTIVNLRWYAQGDIHQDRGTRYPLAKISLEDEMAVRDTLQEFKDRQRQPVEQPEQMGKPTARG